MELRREVQEWIADDPDPTTAAIVQDWLDTNNEVELRASFSGFLQFGTAGLRGPVRPGPSGMNRAVVGRTAAAIAAYMKERQLTSVVIGRDARHGSEDFTQETAQIMSGAGMKVYVLPRPLPTPVLAFATNELTCDVGIMVTASHNPPQDNGYKVYLGGTVDGIHYRGSQIVSPTDESIAAHINAITSLASQPRGDVWSIVDEEIISKYIRITAAIADRPGDLKIVYTAMHGVGTETLLNVFQKAGFPSPILVDAQAQPDPDFPTVVFPNPEEPGAIDLALETARATDADLVIANDPDADRCAAAVNDPVSGWRMLRGDELGAIFGESIARTTKKGILANSIVSSTILSKIAAHYNLDFKQTLTGFKWLAKIDGLTFGYEEALGYAVDAITVNDKDGISAAIKLAQIATDLAHENRTLLNLLDEIWARHGFHATEQISIRLTDLSQVGRIMGQLRLNPPSVIAGYPVTSIDDLATPSDDLPPTDGLRIWLDSAVRIIIRPSGTEAKMKCYIEVIAQDLVSAMIVLDRLRAPLKELLS
ncbi:MAG: phospho-sugar mutase [Candidatus Planktophila sp.]|nr:phospho-sugar mutase [Candidatus Planktophila sp.]